MGDISIQLDSFFFEVLATKNLTGGTQKLVACVDVFTFLFGAFFRFHVRFEGCTRTPLKNHA